MGNYLFDDEKLIYRLKSLRNEKQVSLEQVGNAIGISKGQLSKYENKKKNAPPQMTINTAVALASYYNVPLDYLLGFSESRSRDLTDAYTAKRFGLSDGAMKSLRHRKKSSGIMFHTRECKTNLINFLIENEAFWKDFEGLLINYFWNVKQDMRKESQNALMDKRIKPSDISKMELYNLFQDFIDCCNDCYVYDADESIGIGEEEIK